jgi:hypothetical protein
VRPDAENAGSFDVAQDRLFDFVSREEAARDFAQDDTSRWKVGERLMRRVSEN